MRATGHVNLCKIFVNLRRSHINDKPLLQYRDVCDQMHLINMLFKEILCQVFRALSLFFDLLPFKQNNSSNIQVT